MTNKYEALMIFSVAGGEEGVNALKEKFNDLQCLSCNQLKQFVLQMFPN